MKIVSLVLPLPLFQEFSYFVPSCWEEKVQIGSLVEVEFRKRRLMGLVRSFEESDPRELKPIDRVVPVSPWTEKRMAFAERLSQICFAPLGEIAGLFFPPLLSSQWRFLEKRVFLAQDLLEWRDFPSRGISLFLFREIFGPAFRHLHKFLKEGIFRLEDGYPSQEEVLFSEENFRFWRIALREERVRWLGEMIEKASRDKRKTLLVFPDFQSLDVFEAFLRKMFPEKKIVRYDSRLSTKKRMVAYQMVAEDQYEVILGTRLALFLPASDVSLHILFDPEEQGHYSERSPHYHALQVLYEKVRMRGGTLEIVGVIPPLWIYHSLRLGRFQEGDFGHSESVRTKKIRTVALEKKGGKPVLASSVREAVARTVSLGGKALVWVQKTGYASALGCRECGFYYLCPDCEVALRYHLDWRLLFCPLCGKKVKPHDLCPVCGGNFWESWGEAIEMVYEEFRRYFPRHDLWRVDAEIPWRDFAPEVLQLPGIVVGTSAMLREELLRRSSLLVVLSFENWLYLSDLNARDEFYGKLHRALFFLGVDTKDLPQVIIQGSSDSVEKVEHFLKPWQEFYGESLRKREVLGYPPFRYLVRVVGESRNKDQCVLVLNILRQVMGENGIEVTGPFPGAGSRKRGKWTEELNLHFEEGRLGEVFNLVARWMVSSEKGGIKWSLEVER